MRKCLLLVFTIFTSILLMSQNTSAVSNLSANVSFFASRTPYWSAEYGNCPSRSGSSGYVLNTGSTSCLVGGSQFDFTSAVPVSNGMFMEVNMSLYNLTDNNSLDAYTSRIVTAWLNFNSSNPDPALYYAGATFSQLSASNGQITYLFYIAANSTANVSKVGFSNTFIELKPSEAVSVDSIVFWNVSTSGTGGGNVQWSDLRPHLDAIQLEIRTKANEIGDLLRAQSQHQQETIDAINNVNEDQKEEAEQATQEAEDTAYEQSSEAETQSQTLLQAFTGFVGAITSATPTSCTINGDLGRVDLGSLNFCRDPAPAFVQIIGSIIAIIIVVPLSYHTAKRMLNTIRSFQS